MKTHFIIIVMLVSLLCMAGCEGTPQYSGSSAHWKGYYTVNSNDDVENGRGTLIYKGEKPENIKKVKWSVTDNTSEQSGDGTFTGAISINESSNGAKHQKDEPFHVIIEWDAQKETFDMKLSN
ncbi:hypothetical protein [Metabacillus sp. RGM 3146]|uniref:hypothetical protein n=1 Tax=Metabacillus sp. RGM 3146 TaxID=3401092 RepID=UPI003B9C2376